MIDKESIKGNLDKVWRALFKKLDKKYEDNLFFAGGCFQSLALNEEVNDYDLFLNSSELSHEIYLQILDKFNSSIVDKGKSLYFYCDDYQINFVKRFFRDYQSTINSFDFQHTQSYYGNKKIHFSPSLGLKKLFFNRECENAIGSVYRLKKFLSRGYIINSSEIVSIFEAAAKHSCSYFPNHVTKSIFQSLSSFYQDNV